MDFKGISKLDEVLKANDIYVWWVLYVFICTNKQQLNSYVIGVSILHDFIL